MGPVFYPKILKHGSTFLTEPKFSGFRMAKNPKNHEIFEKWAYVSRKILTNGYPFLPKSPLKMGKGFEVQAAHPCPTQIWVPPGLETISIEFLVQGNIEQAQFSREHWHNKWGSKLQPPAWYQSENPIIDCAKLTAWSLCYMYCIYQCKTTIQNHLEPMYEWEPSWMSVCQMQTLLTLKC